MTRDELHKYGVLQAIEDLHMNINGSSDILSNWCEFNMQEVYDALVDRMRDWKYITPSKYDNCVFYLLQEVLWEYEDYDKR